MNSRYRNARIAAKQEGIKKAKPVTGLNAAAKKKRSVSSSKSKAAKSNKIGIKKQK